MHHPRDRYKNKVVCVTGAGGSIGSEICRRLVEYGVSKLVMVGHSEIGLYHAEKSLRSAAPAGAIVAELASITDARRMEDVMERHGVQIVINAAAHKHVPLCEQNAFEAIVNNVGGAMTLARASARFGVEQFIQISTDKAVKPASVMGATKRVCELFLEFFGSRTRMRITTVRFGNVLDSSGSVLPLWREQIVKGQPITLTDRRCTRFFMSIPEAVDLTLGAGSLPRGGLYVLDMGEPRNIGDLLDEVCRDAGRPTDYKVIETGLRPGEKLTEELSYGGDLVKTPLPKVLAVREHGGRHVPVWSDFDDLVMAALCRHDKLAKEKLWELVR